MAGVFLSYDRDDTDRARPIALALERAGHEVWWDLHVRGGAQFSKVIEEALKAADVVVVLWSANSIESAWVRDEAAVGRDTGRLVPVTIDGTPAPLGFRQFQTIDLSSWSGRGKQQQLQMLLEAVESFDGGRSPPPPAPKRTEPIRIAPRMAVATGALAVAAAALLLWHPWVNHNHVPIVAVVAADRRSESDALARDLLVKLGGMHAATTGGVHLAAAGEAAAPADLVFEASAGTDAQRPQADLTLKRGGDRTILWSKSFEPESRNRTDLQEQLTLNAGKVLECAVEALDPSNARLSRDTIGLYLTACARLAEDYGADTGEVTQLFHKVVAQAPRFKAAWSKLLIAEAEAYGQDESDSRWPLKADIAAARRVDPNLPEIAIAELTLVPTGDYGRAWALIDRAAKLAPESAYVLSKRSLVASTAGFMNDSIQDAQQAAALDPLSPGMRNGYISALIYSGRFDAAQAELRTAERIWPGSSTVADARYRMNLRYGDPKIALEMLPKMGRLNELNESFLKARMDRSPANVDHAVSLARTVAQQNPALSLYAQTAGEFGREDELFDALLHWKRADLASEIGGVLFRPALHRFRQDPRFMQVAARMGLVKFWQSTDNWPDFCFEPDLPYDCKKEAAKLKA